MADSQQLTTAIDIEAQQRLTINGTDINTSSKQQRVVKRSAGQRGPDGKIKVETEVESLKASLSLPGGVTIDFDSEKENEAGEGPFAVLTDLLKLTASIKYSAILWLRQSRFRGHGAPGVAEGIRRYGPKSD